MSQKLRVVEIATKALELIGAFPSSMVAPDPDELRRTVEWMDMRVAELAGTQRMYFLTPATTTSTLTADTASYTLSTLMGTSYPSSGILFPVAAYLRDSNGTDIPIDIIVRSEYEEIEDKTLSGPPEKIYIDRLNASQQVYVWPVPTDATYSLRLVFQVYPTTMTGGSPSSAGNLAHGFAQEWQWYITNVLAATIGSGPVRRLPVNETDRFLRDAQVSLDRLTAYANTQKSSKGRRTKAGF